jgi:alcohol dehydrogenase class IV
VCFEDKEKIMKPFTYYQPTRLFFGCGERHQAGNIIRNEARKILFVADPGLIKAAPEMVRDVRHSLNEAGVAFVEYDQVTPNPTLEEIQTGAELAKKNGVEACLGMGGGSTIDTAKAIAVAATHPGTAWDYLYYKKAPTDKTLPIFAIATTAGTGTQTSKVSVFTNTTEKKKSAMWNDHLLCRAAIIDPEIMLTLPPRITASTGFDVFTHAFESLININSIVFVDLLALEAIALVIKNLPSVVKDGSDIECRSNMAWADTLAGMCLANVGTTLPHAAGQPLSGHFPHISHGESLAVVYPAFAEFTHPGAPAKFAQVARLFNPALEKQNDAIAAASFQGDIEAFLERIGLRCYLEDFGVTEGDLAAVLDHAMEFPDHTVNPVPPTREDMWNIYQKSFRK